MDVRPFHFPVSETTLLRKRAGMPYYGTGYLTTGYLTMEVPHPDGPENNKAARQPVVRISREELNMPGH
jgi:hypothetical protein